MSLSFLCLIVGCQAAVAIARCASIGQHYCLAVSTTFPPHFLASKHFSSSSWARSLLDLYSDLILPTISTLVGHSFGGLGG